MKHEQEWFDSRADVLQNLAIKIAIVRPVQFGIQATINDTNIKLTFYYNKNQYHFNRTGKMVKFAVNNEYEVLAKHYLESHEVMISKSLIIETLEDKGVQACIDHINKKAASITKPELATLLKITAQELTQYL